ncbi:MAG TPA: hypothetical protein VIZ18_05040 [Ktedonobacteraceae bacterium]
MENQGTTSIAVLSPELAWKLLTPEEQKRLLIYLEKMREREKQADKK